MIIESRPVMLVHKSYVRILGEMSFMYVISNSYHMQHVKVLYSFYFVSYEGFIIVSLCATLENLEDVYVCHSVVKTISLMYTKLGL